MYLLNTGFPFAKLTVCMSSKELAGLSRMMKAYNTPFLDEASYNTTQTNWCQPQGTTFQGVPEKHLSIYTVLDNFALADVQLCFDAVAA